MFRSLTEDLGEGGNFGGLHQADAAFAFSALFRQIPGNYVWLCLDNREAETVAHNLRFFLPQDRNHQILIIPGSEADPYRGLSPHPEIAEKRAVGLWRLLRGYQGFVVTTLASIVTRLPSPATFLSRCIQLETGNFFPLDHLLKQLREMGYVPEDPVGELGEYSRRGGIVDLYSPSRENPVRIEFFGDEIESIREFDSGTQRSVELVPQCEIVPMREMVLDERKITHWHEKAPLHWNEVRFADALKEKLQFTANREPFNGFEYLFPLVVENAHHLLDFLPEAKLILPRPTKFFTELEQLESNLHRNFRDRDAEGELALPPERLFFDKAQLREWLRARKVFYADELWPQPEPSVHFDFRSERKYRGRIQDLLADLEDWQKKGERVVFVMASRGLAERLIDILREYEIGIYLAEEGLEDAYSHPLSVTLGKLSEGFHSPRLKLHVLTQENVFEESQLRPVARKAGRREVSAKFLSDFRDLKEGDYIVHFDHGIGIFRGMTQLGVGETVREFVLLEYRDDAKLYVPIDRLDLIQKYSGGGETRPPLDRLGGVSWEKTKQRIKRSMRRMAEDLLKLYARRQVARGHAFQPDDTLSREFEEAFEYGETSDQRAAIVEVKQDMESPRPMDRLICGDVGYGKTEVAMRAAFKAVNDSKQVAVLAPTTVLSLQHFNTFCERFRAFPVTIEMMSRFRSRKEQTEILKRTSLGQVDILIGTHRLLSRDIQFRDLGLTIVDEEQRFGVGHKEKLKQLKTSVDVLTLSATPIPRTLNMSMIGLRDLSMIETPPKDRLAIQTVVVKFSRNIIHSAVDLELRRQGQVFFVHNSVETIYSVARMVQEIAPAARVAVGHGQMSERQLEEVMLDFVNHKYDVLVSTTIIENGLDIPRVNTLIVNQASRFGLAQLYQLRGRVGRSSRRAYAYLLVSDEETLTTQARNRLAAIQEFSDLGAGFRIAALDLEIRGAGNLLGGEQHGHIGAVGLDLYTKLLERTLRELKGEKVTEAVQTSIDLRLDIQIPDHYIGDSNLRLWLYKRISSVPDRQGLQSLNDEVVDRFGKHPRSISNLFEYARLRLRAEEFRILSLERRGQKVFMKFREDTPVLGHQIVDLARRNGHISLSPEGVLSFEVTSALPSDIFTAVHTTLNDIGGLH